ncbi:hypothetical protein GGI21_005618, partial [Coemansia aciculifera]
TAAAQDSRAGATTNADRRISVASGMPSEDEFYDCASLASTSSSAKPSVDCATVCRSRPTTRAADNAASDEMPELPESPESPKSQRFRSLTSSRVPNSGNSTSSNNSNTSNSGSRNASVSAPHSSLRRSATTRANAPTKFGGGTSSLVEERARQAVRAMAEACTTGVSVREADERRGRAFSRLLVGRRLSNSGVERTEAPAVRSSSASSREGTRSTSNEDLSLKPRLKHIPLHQVSSHGNTTGLSRADSLCELSAVAVASAADSVSLSSATPESESRTLSMTDDRKAMTITRSASLEARFD